MRLFLKVCFSFKVFRVIRQGFDAFQASECVPSLIVNISTLVDIMMIIIKRDNIPYIF